MTRRRKLLFGAAAIGLVLVLVAAPALIVRFDTRGERSTDPASLPHKQVAIVLGAGIRGDGRPTLFLRDRLNGAIRLYQLGKVDGLLMTDIDAAGLGVPDWGTYPDGQMARYQAREVLASVKAMWDVDLGHPDPRFLGPHVQLNLQPAGEP